MGRCEGEKEEKGIAKRQAGMGGRGEGDGGRGDLSFVICHLSVVIGDWGGLGLVAGGGSVGLRAGGRRVSGSGVRVEG